MLPTNHATGKLGGAPAPDTTAHPAGLHAFVESSHDAIVSQTREGVITDWNPAAADLYGYTAQEIVGHNIDVLYPPESRIGEAEILRRILAGRRVDGYRAERVGKTCRQFTVSMTASPVTDLHGDIVGASSTGRELTARQQAETRLRDLTEAVPDGLVGVGADGRITMVNDETLRLFGYRRSELVGMPVEVLLPRAVQAAHAAHRARFWSNPRSRPMGTRIQLAGRRCNGSQFPIGVSLSTVGAGSDMTAVAFVRDLTDPQDTHAHTGAQQIHAVADLLDAQAERDRSPSWLPEARRLDALGALAGGIAHEFNNILAAILGYTELLILQRGADDGSRTGAEIADTPHELEEIQSAVDRGAHVTRRLLAFARRAVITPRHLNLNDVIASTERPLAQAIGDHITVATHLAPDLWPVTADPDQIRAVLLELADNARRAMPATGTLVIDTANVTLDQDAAAARPGLRPGRHVRLRVIDTGAGMPPEVAHRAFEPFFTTQPMGGLGLAAVHGITGQAGGHAAIYSKPGTGTIVTLLLPASVEAESQPAL